MELGSSMSSGAVACPVCTLYLREGISLQKHLDTHPKEQVIEALIKASTSPAQQPQLNLSQPAQNPIHSPPNPVASQSPYPVGPVFECPPVAPMMSPQFASFSYQQFVNNGTMMIPQYAMAPQANQMMQMLYNPYGMYQQQQIPAVQMIAPISNVPTTSRSRPMVSVASDSGARNIIPPLNSAELEPKQILPEIEAEQVLPDVEMSVGSMPLSREPTVSTNQREGEDQSDRNQAQQGRHDSIPPHQDGSSRIEYGNIVQNSAMSNSTVEDDGDKGESVLPDIEDTESTSPTQQVPIQHEHTQTQNSEEFTQNFEGDSEKERNSRLAIIEIDLDAEDNKLDNEEQNLTEHRENMVVSVEESMPVARVKGSNEQPEVEQLERLLITIMDTEFNVDSLKSKNEKIEDEERNEKSCDQEVIVGDRETSVIQEVAATSNIGGSRSCVKIPEADRIRESFALNKDNDDRHTSVQTDVIETCAQEASTHFAYSYKNSISAPASPATQKSSYRLRTYSTRSEMGSNENLSSYPVGFEATTLLDEEDNEVDEKREFRDNFDEEDMEIDEITSPHTPFTKHNENVECVRSHTPLSTLSGISGLRVRTDLSKPCSPASTHSFQHLDTNSLCPEDDAEEMIDPATEKDPIDCMQLQREVELMENLKNISQKLQPNHVYHQSVITENLATFAIEHHSQKSMTIHDRYTEINRNNTDNLLDLSEPSEPTTSTDSKNFQPDKSILHKPTAELLNINEDAHPGPMNVLEFDGLQILVPSTFISESSQKAVSATSRQSMVSSEGGVEADEEIKSVNMRADEIMPPRGELSEQESNGCHEPSAWQQLYMGQESSRMSTSYDLMARESWEESEGSDNEIGGPLLDSRSLATHFTSSLFLDRDRKTPTKRSFKCPHCSDVFDCPKERRVHTGTVHKEAGPSSSRDPMEEPEVKDIKLLDGRMNVFDDLFVPGLHVQQPLLHQLQPAHHTPDLTKLEVDRKIENLIVPTSIEISCSICGQMFNSEKSLQIHHRRVHVSESNKRVRESAKCQTCNEEFPSVVLFNTHLKIHPLECGQCGKYFYRKQNFKLHMKRHLGIKPFPCTVCDKAFLTKQKLDEHTNGHTGNAPVKCNLCNETFRRYSNLTQHKNRHHLNIKKKLKDYICHCGEVFHTKKKLAWHKETHDEKPKACTYCNERFIHMASLTRHMRRAHNRRFVPDAQRENENVECPICKCIYLRSSLAVHMRVHNGERPYECQVCSKAFSTKWNLQLHKWTHAARSTKPFKCNQCSAAFYRHSDYTAHMNSHRNVRPYTCNYCGAQFIRKYNCLRHVKEHEENKSYTCDICNKTFHRSYYLKEHLRVHSGARPYTCHICGKSSSTKSNHNKHVRIHHAREPVNTEN
ncbi:uncharacterized protein LOC124299061 isoform X1 [Neodiprion virginianus]|uniref:uncharacterized protein LOC124299061 isoform X1 n=1 Tax=Neodiprion virginianus TaxID=2961670 RepID=UPI001EE6F336|nr:uncharacterized protein LOC124299061 isoform X1 [Neodiprion virginianus]